jgi:hypothetical protein
MRPNHFRTCLQSGVLVTVFCILAAKPAYCWDKFAHEIIAQIAYERLTPAAKADANQLIAALNNDPDVAVVLDDYKPYNFVTAAAWMDDMRPPRDQPTKGTKLFNTWHYIDLPEDPNLTKQDVENYRDGNSSNAYLAITTICIPTLKEKTATTFDRARALGFLLHLEGDIHQPLHCSGWLAGGNGYDIDQIPSADPTYPIRTLHPFWDGAYRYSGANGKISVVITASDLPRIDHPGADPVKTIADKMMADYGPAADDPAANDLDPADWALESSHVVTTFVYPALNSGHTLTPDYVQKAHDIACRRITLAGVRLANLLNLLLGQSGD